MNSYISESMNICIFIDSFYKGEEVAVISRMFNLIIKLYFTKTISDMLFLTVNINASHYYQK